jgi:hypothetical protein
MKRLLALAGMLAVFAALAIEPPKPAAAPATPAPAKSEPAKSEPAKDEPAAPDADTAAPPAGEAAKPADADDEELPPLPPDAAPAGPPPQRFNPTEKVRADFPVSFPIDI